MTAAASFCKMSSFSSLLNTAKKTTPPEFTVTCIHPIRKISHQNKHRSKKSSKLRFSVNHLLNNCLHIRHPIFIDMVHVDEIQHNPQLHLTFFPFKRDTSYLRWVTRLKNRMAEESQPFDGRTCKEKKLMCT